MLERLVSGYAASHIYRVTTSVVQDDFVVTLPVPSVGGGFLAFVPIY